MHEITLWTEALTMVGQVCLPAYPIVGDVVRDEDGREWIVTGRQWHAIPKLNASALVLLVRER